MPSPRTLTGLLSTSRRIEQDAVSDEWRPLPPRPALERFRFRRQQHYREVNDTRPSAGPTASSSTRRRREKWDGRVLRASSLRQKIDRERTQRQSAAASISTRQLRDVASRRAKLFTLQTRLERECREEMDREAGGKSQVEGVHQGDHCTSSGGIGQRQDLSSSSRKVSTRKKADGDSSETKATATQMGGDALVCSPNDDVPYLQFITRKIERENEDEDDDDDDASKQEEEEEEEEEKEEISRRYTHASTSPARTEHSSLASLADNENEVDSSPEWTFTPEKGGDALTAIGSPSTADDLATKVKELEERLERLGNHTGTHDYDSTSESESNEAIGVGKDEHSENSGASATSSSIENISKDGDAEDLLGSFESTFGDDDDGACKDSSTSPSASRPRPPVLLVPHENDAIYTSLAHYCPSVTTLDTSGPAQEQSIGFEGIVLGSLIDSIP